MEEPSNRGTLVFSIDIVIGLNSKNFEEKGEIPFELGYIGRLNGVSFQELRARGRMVQIASVKCHAKSYHTTEGL